VLITVEKVAGQMHGQLTGDQAAADREVPALKKTLRQLMI